MRLPGVGSKSASGTSGERWKQVCSAVVPTRSEASRTTRESSAAQGKYRTNTLGTPLQPRSQWQIGGNKTPRSAKLRVAECPDLETLLGFQEARSICKDRHPSERGLGHAEPVIADVAKGTQVLSQKLQELEKLDAELEMERPDNALHNVAQAKLDAVRKMVAFLKYGGEVPENFHVECETFASGAFVSRVPILIGGFLVTKGRAIPGREPAARRAVYSIQGIAHGQLAVRKLANAGLLIDPEIRRLAISDPDAFGGWTVDPKKALRLMNVVSPGTLLSWTNHILTHEVANFGDMMKEAVEEEHRRNEEEHAARLRMDLYIARAEWRAAIKRMHGPLLRELWACLWMANFARVRSVAMALKRLGIDIGDRVFHEVTVSGYGAEDKYFVVLEDAGATLEELDFQWQETIHCDSVTFVRRHAQATALDAYECMRGDNAAPVGVPAMRAWLTEQCGAPMRKVWSSQFLTKSPGRNAMVSKSFVQQILVDLVNQGLAVKFPKVPESIEELHDWEYNPSLECRASSVARGSSVFRTRGSAAKGTVTRKSMKEHFQGVQALQRFSAAATT